MLDHLAKPAIAAGAWEPWASGHRRAGRTSPNVSAKLSGLVTEADWDTGRPRPAAVRRPRARVRARPPAVRLRLAGVHAGRDLHRGGGVGRGCCVDDLSTSEQAVFGRTRRDRRLRAGRRQRTGDAVKVDLAYGETRPRDRRPRRRTTVVTPRQLDASGPTSARALQARPPQPDRGSHRCAIECVQDRRWPSRCATAPASAAPRSMVPAAPRRAGRHHRSRRHRRAGRDRHPSWEHRRRAGRDVGQEVLERVRVVNHDARDASMLHWVGRLAGDVPVALNRQRGSMQTSGSRPASSSPTSSPGSAGARRWWRPGWPGSRRCWLSTTPVESATRRPHGGSPSAIPSTTLSAPSRRPTGRRLRDRRAPRPKAADRRGLRWRPPRGARRPRVRPPGTWPWCRCPAAFDVVVTTNAGYPLDQNLYQCVKGMSAGASVVRSGGTVICAAECRDGFPDHGSYRDVLSSEPTPARCSAPSRRRPETIPDQWQAQVQARVQARARVLMHTGGLTDADLEVAHLEPVADVSAAVRDELARHGPEATLCVLPEGPADDPLRGGDEMKLAAHRSRRVTSGPRCSDRDGRAARPVRAGARHRPGPSQPG